MTPFILVIFGATGDLAKNKLIPGLFSLYKNNMLPEQFFIIGFSRRTLSDSEFAAYHQHEDPLWDKFAQNLIYQQGNFDEIDGYASLIQKLTAIDERMGACVTRIFYLATPPVHYEEILGFLDMTKLSEGCGQGSSDWTRIAIEKPFGKDLDTAKMLDKKLSQLFKEKQIFRVDHYLGKETVQNLLIFRFANSIFDPVWNKEYIDHVQITFSEKKDVSGRGAFFDGVGMLRDVAQNHLMQLLASVVMEMPKSFAREDVRDARAKAIGAITCISPEEVSQHVVRGQYEGYTQEPAVNPDSKTETFVAAKFFVDSPRFEGVPFYFRAGKGMADDLVTISLVFKQTCHMLFREVGCPEEGNVLTIRIQPDEGLYFRIIAKKPGPAVSLQTATMHFSYAEQFGTTGIDAYERLLLDIMTGDQMLFNRSDELDASWQFITTILEGWDKFNSPVLSYVKGSNGPEAAEFLIGQGGRKWI